MVRHPGVVHERFIGTDLDAVHGPGRLRRRLPLVPKRENEGEDFFYPLGSVFDDVFVDGLTFPFSNFRSPQPGVEETPGEEGFGKWETPWWCAWKPSITRSLKSFVI